MLEESKKQREKVIPPTPLWKGGRKKGKMILLFLSW
ncbi:hypothetical protein CWATWH0003_3928 [Crocosphaera watsonii WH 0003]|uniref:Uncharacterized protein n=1 Tax=Crocosphaera watsonii WH 0003 TaxID=423471 RepID=G5J909_CROWT|nr:hypothetical protein CWATWH0003_3928 [Crocosphaera watsonii WH 0003]